MSRPLLIDTDPGCDDAVALLLALEHAALDVVGLTTVHGNAAVEDTTTNARAILESVDRTDVPVARGADRPLLVDLETSEHVHGEGGIKGELPESGPATEPVDTHAARYIVEQARAHEGELTLAAIGPLTNVALALAIEPELPELLDDLLVMGGAAFTAGNVTPLAEANFHTDPHAARRVVRDCDPTIVGLDVTQRAAVPPRVVDGLESASDGGSGTESESSGKDAGPLERSVREWLTYYDDNRLERYGIESAAIHDALVIAGLVDERVLETERYHLQVGTDSDLDRGALVADENEVTGAAPNGAVAVAADYERYRKLVGNSLTRTLENRGAGRSE